MEQSLNRAAQYKKFNKMVAELLLFCDRSLISIKILECWRSPQAAALNAINKVGVVNSKHIYSLAIDMAITIPSGLALADVKDERYKKLGEFWESIGGKWGGRFSQYSDIYHFELNELPYKKK